MRTGVRHRSVRRGAGRVARPVGWAAAAALLALSLVGPSAVGAASPPQPTYGSAVVDGKTGDWDLSADKFSDLTDTGQADSPVRGHLYLRYDCTSETLYALVLGVDDIQFQQTRPEDAYIRIDGSGKAVSGNSGNDGTPPDFSWVNPDGKLADGFEGSAPLSPGNYTVRAHVLRPSEREDGYTPVDNVGRADPLEIVCKKATADPDRDHAADDRTDGSADGYPDEPRPGRDRHAQDDTPADRDDRLQRRAAVGVAVDGLPGARPGHRRVARPDGQAAPGTRSSAKPLTYAT